MNKIIPILLLGVLVLSGLGASALQQSDINEYNFEQSQDIPSNTGNRDYTHTVLVEVGTRTTCSACPASNLAWHSLYDSGNYDFQYTELVYDKNSVAYSRFAEFNPAWVPTSYWDGGEYVLPGTNTGTFVTYLDASGSRVVPDLVADLNISWLGGAEIEIIYNVVNNEATNYPGKLRIYVIELESTLWNDFNGNPYYHAFLDFPVNQAIDIPAGDTLSGTVTWDGAASGYPGITQDNIQVILAVFDDEAHQSYSDPPSGNPFWAYYSDECVAAEFEAAPNEPPETPTITGETNGVAGETYNYTFCTTDPNGDNVYYIIDWGDDTANETIGPFPSGICSEASHTWAEEGDYTIKAKAQDSNGAESDWGTLEITMPVNYQIYNYPLLQLFLERFPNAFLLLRQLLEIL